MIVYRICRSYPPDHNPLDGRGAAKYGGRWNSIGKRVVYTSSSLSVARSELARHINLESIPDGYRVYEIEIPDDNYVETTHKFEDSLPEWNFDMESLTTRKIGDDYLADKTVLAFKVPSVCDPKQFNYLLNPDSDSYYLVKVIDDYPFVA